MDGPCTSRINRCLASHFTPYVTIKTNERNRSPIEWSSQILLYGHILCRFFPSCKFPCKFQIIRSKVSHFFDYSTQLYHLSFNCWLVLRLCHIRFAFSLFKIFVRCSGRSLIKRISQTKTLLIRPFHLFSMEYKSLRFPK